MMIPDEAFEERMKIEEEMTRGLKKICHESIVEERITMVAVVCEWQAIASGRVEEADVPRGFCTLWKNFQFPSADHFSRNPMFEMECMLAIKTDMRV